MNSASEAANQGGKCRPTHALTFDIEDWFHIVEVNGLGNPDDWPSLPSIVERRSEEILDILRKHRVRATFFILGWIAERYPRLVRVIAEAGHEIASHSHLHRRVDQMQPKEFEADTIRSLDAIEAVCGVRPVGYRAPTFSITKGAEWAFDVLLDCGITWDSSLYPGTRAHGGYPCGDRPFRAVAPSGRYIREVPIGLLRLLGMGLCVTGGGYLRVTPTPVILSCVRRIEREQRPTTVYLHPRDFAVDCPRYPMAALRRFKCYAGISSTRFKLERLLRTFRFGPCTDLLNEWCLG